MLRASAHSENDPEKPKDISMETAENMAAAFEAEAGSAPVVNVSGVDASTVITGTENNTTLSNLKFYTEDDLARVRSQEKEKLYPQIESLKEELNSIRKEKEEVYAVLNDNNKRIAIEKNIKKFPKTIKDYIHFSPCKINREFKDYLEGYLKSTPVLD